jgi:nitronate monooxygenase
VVDAVGVPVIAAGGIADRRGLAAVLALFASDAAGPEFQAIWSGQAAALAIEAPAGEVVAAISAGEAIAGR